MTDNTDESCSSLDGCESPHHKRYKLEKGNIEMKRKDCDSEPGSLGNSQHANRGIDGLELGHDWNEQFGFKVERPTKTQYESLKEQINVANALLFSLTPAAPHLICQGRSYKEVIEIFVCRAGDIDEDGNGTIHVAWWEVKCSRTGW